MVKDLLREASKLVKTFPAVLNRATQAWVY